VSRLEKLESSVYTYQVLQLHSTQASANTMREGKEDAQLSTATRDPFESYKVVVTAAGSSLVPFVLLLLLLLLLRVCENQAESSDCRFFL
jgi:hypothetical protein